MYILGDFLSGNFPNFQFPKPQLPKGWVRSSSEALQVAKGSWARADLGSSHLGNCILGNLPLRKISLGSFGKMPLEKLLTLNFAPLPPHSKETDLEGVSTPRTFSFMDLNRFITSITSNPNPYPTSPT